MSATLRSFTDFIFYSRLRVIGVAFAISFIPLIGPTLSIVIAGLVTLRQGAWRGFGVMLAATLPCFLQLPLLPLPDGLWVLGIISTGNLLTWGYACLLRRSSGNWGLILELTALIGIITVVTAHVLKPDLEMWWEKQLTTHISQILPSMESAGAPTTTTSKKQIQNQSVREEPLEPEVISLVNTIKPYVTGALAASFLLNVLLQLFIARWWQLLLFDPKRLRLELHQIHLTSMAGLVFLSTLILSYLKIPLAHDLLPVLYLTFCLAGLSLVHYTAGKLKGLTWLCLIVFYVVLIGTWMAYKLPLVFQLIALAALLDIWFDWRGRLDKRFTH